MTGKFWRLGSLSIYLLPHRFFLARSAHLLEYCRCPFNSSDFDPRWEKATIFSNSYIRLNFEETDLPGSPMRIVNHHNAAYSVFLQEKETLRS